MEDDSLIKHTGFFLPTFNEERNIYEVLKSVSKVFKGYIFVVDGYSTDDTVSIAKSLGVDVYMRESHGKGSAIIKAIEIAKSKGIQFLIYFDCDQTFEPNDIIALLEKIKFSDVVIGERPMGLIKPFHRRLGNYLITFLINFFFNSKLKDTLTGFKCLRVDKFYKKITLEGFAADPLIFAIALRNNYIIEKITINYYPRIGKSKMGIIVGSLESVKLFYVIIKQIVFKRSSF